MVLPHPHPWRQQKSPARGASKLETNVFLMIFYDYFQLTCWLVAQLSQRRHNVPQSQLGAAAFVICCGMLGRGCDDPAA